MILGLDIRFLGRKWQKKNIGRCNGKNESLRRAFGRAMIVVQFPVCWLSGSCALSNHEMRVSQNPRSAQTELDECLGLRGINKPGSIRVQLDMEPIL